MTDPMPLIPIAVCGRHGLPSWLHLVRAAASAVRLDILDQVKAGIDIISDGEMRCVTFIRAVDEFHFAGPHAGRVCLALEHVPAECLRLVPDCGLWETPRRVGVSTLRSIVEAARMIRRELGVA